jgi:NCAIR mutase (PurE)-related protein
MPGSREDTYEILERVARGEPRLAVLPFLELDFARPDVHRELRQGAPEAVLAQGKTPEQVVEIVRAMIDGGAGSVLVTRADAETRARVRAAIPDAYDHDLANLVWVVRRVPEPRGLVAIVSAGTSDGPVVHEARVRAELLGANTVVYEDVGVAGLHRLVDALPDLTRADCVVVVAGMDGALASVVGGLVAAPVVGVPTSVGYGVADGGRTALKAMLTSCAAALAVVGIDDGLGAGTVAARIARGR